MLERDFWWPGTYEDVRPRRKTCEQCLAERGTSGVSAWTRAELYSRPLRVLQFDTVSCADGSEPGAKHVLTCICCFSRWCWLCPTRDRTADTIASTSLTHVMLGMATFPAVFRSDNAREFVSDVVSAMNRRLGIKHITGSAYHPPAQGDERSGSGPRFGAPGGLGISDSRCGVRPSDAAFEGAWGSESV